MIKFKNKPIFFKKKALWLKAREDVVTATELSSLFSLNPYASAKKMLENKLCPSFQENSYTFVGRVLEPAVVLATSLILNRKFELFTNDPEEYLMFIHPDHKIGATPDAIFKDVLLECKTATNKNYEKWFEHPPFNYILQCHSQMYCSVLSTTVLSCISTNLSPKSFVDPFPIKIYLVDEDKTLSDLMVRTVDRFWSNVKSGHPFEVERSDAKDMKELLLNSIKLIK